MLAAVHFGMMMSLQFLMMKSVAPALTKDSCRKVLFRQTAHLGVMVRRTYVGD